MIADPLRSDSREAEERSSVGDNKPNTLYYKQNGRWFSIVTEALLNPEVNYDIYSGPPKHEQDPVNSL